MNHKSLSTCLAILLLALTSLPASGQDTVTQTGVFFQLGKALNRAFLERPRPRQNYLGLLDRSHYATNVYAYEGVASANHDVNVSRGLFVHFDLDRSASRKIKAGHSLAE